MPSNFRKFGPLFVALITLWSFMISFTLGLIVTASVFAAAVFIYQNSVKKWQELIEDDFAEMDFGDFDDELGVFPNLSMAE